MGIEDIAFDGFLDSGVDLVSVEVAYASTFTVFVKFKENNQPAFGAEYRGLILTISDSEFEFGPCRLVPGECPAGYAGRLQFVADFIDFDVFFREKRIINIETITNNLALILSQKDKVKGQFKNYIADLTYDIKAYKQLFDEIDMKLAREPEDVREAVFQTVADTLGVKFAGFFDDGLIKLERLISGYSKEEHELHGYYLRKQLWDIIICSEFMARTNIKPRGYAGDSEMMRMLYENEYVGNSSFAKLLNKYSLEVPAAQSVRNRRIMVPGVLRKIQSDLVGRINGPLRIMSVACGPAYELSDLFVTADDCDKFNCTLLDQDLEALNEAEGNIHKIERSLGRTLQAEYKQDSVRTMLRTPELRDKWGSFHFIYSMGLFDYLTQPVAKAVIEKVFGLLEPGGYMLIGNYHFRNKSRWFMEYWLDWVLYYRNEDDMNDLVSGIDTASVSMTFEDSECQMFLLAQKTLR
jgi:extracellular factor (EF) 3-hydroxypalmitic acid methyl ester biosynthesis protein